MIRIPFILIAVLLVTTTYTTAGLEEDLVFYFTFDNVKNKRVLEASGNNLDLCIECAAGNPQYTFKNGSIDEVGLWRRALRKQETQLETAPLLCCDQDTHLPGDRDKFKACYLRINSFRVAEKSPVESV